MQVNVNGEVKKLPENCTVTQLLEIMEITGKRIAVEVNEDIVPRSLHATTHLGEGDVIEVVQAIGGG